MQQEEPRTAALSIQSELTGYGDRLPEATALGVSKVDYLTAQPISARASGVWGQADSTIGTWHTASVSKATETAWEVGDAMGVYIHTSSQIGVSNIKPGCANMEYTAASPTQWTNDVFLLPPFSGLYASAYYPYQSSVVSPFALVHSVKADQSTLENYTLSDLMTTVGASPIDGADMTNVHTKLRFAHRFSKFVVRFEVPSAIDGRLVVGVKSVLFPGFWTTAAVDLSTAGVGSASWSADITPYAVAAGMTVGAMAQYEAVVPPQTLPKGKQIVSVVFTTDGGDKTVSYQVPNYTGDQDMVFASGGKYELTLEAAGSLAFLTQGDFSDGLAKTLPIQVKVYKNQPWSLSSSEGWCTLSFSETTGFGSSLTRSGAANDGGAVTVYVKVLGNTTSAGGWTDRRSVLTLQNTSTGAQVVMPIVQGYSRWEIPGDPSALTAVEQSVAAPLFASNKPWYATIAPTTVAKLTGLGGMASGRYPLVGQHLGALLATTNLKYDFQANNTDVDRTVSVTYMPTTKEGGADVTSDQKLQTLTQRKAVVTDFVHTLVDLTRSAGGFTSPTMSVTPGKGLQWKISSSDATNLTVTRNATQTAAAADVVATVTANNGDAERTLYYYLDYGALSGVLRTGFSVKQSAPSLEVSGNKTVGPHITSDSFQLTTGSNHQGVRYVLSKSAEVTSTTPASVVMQTISGAANLNQRVDLSFPVNTGAARTHTVRVAYGASLSRTYTVTQQAPSLSLSAYSASIGVGGGTISSATLTANVPYSSEVTPSYGGSVSPATGSAPPYTALPLSFTIPAQPSSPALARSHSFVFTPSVDYTGNSQVRTFTVTQAERPVSISLSSTGTVAMIEYGGGSYYTTVTANCDWSVTNSSNVSYSPSSGKAGSTSVRIDVSSHTNTYKRSCNVTFTTRNHSGFSAKSVSWNATQKDYAYLHVSWGLWMGFTRVWVHTNSKAVIYYYNSDSDKHLNETLTESKSWVIGNDGNVWGVTLLDCDGNTVGSVDPSYKPEVEFRINDPAPCDHYVGID